MNQRYEYKFVSVKVSMGFLGRFSKEYQRVIEQHALEGWRFVQAYAPSAAGWASTCDLVFERPRA